MTTSPSGSRPRLALATCAELPDLDPDDHVLREALVARGVPVDAVVWDDPTVDWAQYPHVVIRSTWDYTARPRQFADWARRVERTSTLLNPASAVTWNLDKTYLRDLEGAGLVARRHEGSYALTGLGHDLGEAIAPLDRWSRRWAEDRAHHDPG